MKPRSKSLDVIMKTKLSYNFQHSLLTREVFIMVLGHSQSEEFLIRRIKLVTHLYSIIVTNIVYSKALTNNSISPQD